MMGYWWKMEEEASVFTDSNLGTHMVVSVSPTTSVRDFKRQLEVDHLKCFPHCGEIRVCGLMVKQKSMFYHLTESMLIKHAFQGKKGTWFLNMEAITLDETKEEEKNQSLTNDQSTPNDKSQHFASKNEGTDPPRLMEASSEVSSQIASVTSIIKRYFPSSVPSCSDATSQSREEDGHNSGSHKQSKANTTPTLSFPLLNRRNATGKLKRHEVGKRLVNAADSLKACRSKQRRIRSVQGRGNNSSLIAFDISDSD